MGYRSDSIAISRDMEPLRSAVAESVLSWLSLIDDALPALGKLQRAVAVSGILWEFPKIRTNS